MPLKYNAARTAFGTGNINWATDNIRAVLVDLADYTPDEAHSALDSIPANARVATSTNLAGKTVVDGWCNCADFSFSTVSGDGSEAVVFYKVGANEATSTLIFCADGISVTPNGQNINVTTPATNGLFRL